MAKVACLKDYPEYALMIAALAESGGHTTFLGSPPIDFERVVDFGPQVIVTGLFRKRRAHDRPIQDVEEDVLGLGTLRQFEHYPAIQTIPIVIIGNSIEENEVPLNLNYDLFLYFPDDLHMFLPKLDELAHKVKTRRKISGYHCPLCKSRLTFVQRESDLFCPRCGTSVAVIDRSESTYLDPEGHYHRCRTSDLAPCPRRD